MAASTARDPLSETVAGMGAALLKSLPCRGRIHDRSAAAWGDAEDFASAEAAFIATGADEYAEMVG